MHIVLASASPRRAQLLRQVELSFAIEPSPAPEPLPDGRPPEAFVVHSAQSKARCVYQMLSERGAADGAIVIGADTVVCVDGAIWGKPVDAAQAAQMLNQLSGRSHRVYTGLSLISAWNECSGCEGTLVAMRALTSGDIDAYVSSGEPLDKAGAYGIQGRAARFIESIVGCYYNVVGLPLARLCVLLGDMGYDVTAAVRADGGREKEAL